MRYFIIALVTLLSLGCVVQQDRPAEKTKVVIQKETRVVTQPVVVPQPVIVPRPAPMPPPSHHHGGEHKGGVSIDIDIKK